MVKILRGNKKVRIDKGVIILVKSDNTVEARLILQPTLIDISTYQCVIFISEEVKR